MTRVGQENGPEEDEGRCPCWEQSKGIKGEIEIAVLLGIPVQYVSYTEGA
jgi:hypothetical protein